MLQFRYDESFRGLICQEKVMLKILFFYFKIIFVNVSLAQLQQLSV